jgi:glyoxylate reductase/D-3-phosphoglycerate dehydrogenase/(S)-sulfolactate dehydrogenase
MTKQTPRPATRHVHFLDQDHVVELARSLLSWETDADRNYARNFFNPEQADEARLADVGAAARRNGAITISQGSALERKGKAEVIVFRRGILSKEQMEKLPSLRLIQRLGESAHGIDLAEAAHRSIAVSCLPRPTLIQVAEHVIMFILALSRQLLASDRAVRHGGTMHSSPGSVSYNWPGITGLTAAFGRTIGIVGMGEIGQQVAKRGSALGMKIIYTGRERMSLEREREFEVEWASLDALLSSSDVVSLHAPGAAPGGPLIGRREIALMRPNALFINTSRGRLVDHDALYEALRTRQIAGAALDVFAAEPVAAADRFVELDNLVFTPHLAAGSRIGVLDEVQAILENVADALAGRPIRHAAIAGS